MRKVLLYLAGPCVLLVFLAGWALSAYGHKFNGTDFSAQNVMTHVEELSSAKYAGRQAGTAGNELALTYVEQRLRENGIAPAGDKGTYFQNFRSMVPLFKSEPYFRIKNLQDAVVREYAHGLDYLEVMDNYGRGGRLEGSLLFLAKDITMYEPRELKDQIIVRQGLMDKDIPYAIDSGVKGILILTNNVGRLTRQAISISSKQGKTVPILALTPPGYQALEEYAQQGLKAEINLDVAYQAVETPNVLGKIEGRDKNSVVIISAHIDHVGSTFSGQYFPGALDGASGVGMLLELARVMKAQNIVPEKTVLFAIWNSQEYGMNGSLHYAEHPLYPLGNTQVIVLNLLGANKSSGVILDSSGKTGKVYTGKLAQFFAQNGMGARETLDGRGDDHAPFVNKGVPAVRVTANLYTAYSQGLSNLHTYNDNVYSIDADSMQSTGLGLLEYIRAEVYKDVYPRYLTLTDKLFLALYAIGLGWIYVIYTLNKLNPGLNLGGLRVEDVYYSTLHTILAKGFFYLTPALLIFFALVFVSNIPSNFNILFVNGEAHSNFSLYLTVKKSVLYLKTLFTQGLGVSKTHFKVMDVLPDAFLRSFKLLTSALAFAFAAGTIKGIFDGFRDKGKGDLRTFGTLLALSVPDVMIVAGIQIGLMYLYRFNLLNWLDNYDELRRFAVALICLTIIPTVYISRLSATVVQEELKKDYIRAAKARGLSKLQLVRNHLLRATVLKILATLGPVLTLVISNLIIVEYLTLYPGLVFSLIKFYQQNDTVAFIGFALSLGLIYILLNLLVQLILKLLSPAKREVAK